MAERDEEPEQGSAVPADARIAPVPEVRVFGHDVSIWGDHECTETQLWSLRVGYDGGGQWVIRDGTGYYRRTMDADGTWHLNTGQPALRLDLRQALGIALRHASTLPLKDTTAAQKLREHAVHGCPDGARPAATPARRAVRPRASGRAPARRAPRPGA